MDYVNVKILPRPHTVEFKCVGRLIFDINYIGYGLFEIRRWWHNSKGQYHRENSPAGIWNDGYQCWCRYDKYHREDGPAEIWPNGRQVWCLNGVHYSEENFKKEMRRRHELHKRKNLTKTTQY